MFLAVLVCVVLQLPNHTVHHSHDLLTNHMTPSLPSKYLKMVDKISKIVGRQIDLSSTLSNEDLLLLSMNDTNSKIADLWKDVKEELKRDRKHNKEVIEHVVIGLCKRIDSLEKFVVELSSKHSKLIADLDLKQKTISSYQEHLTCNLDYKVHDLLSRMNKHEMSCHVGVNSQTCNGCDETHNNISDSVVQVCEHHGVATNTVFSLNALFLIFCSAWV